MKNPNRDESERLWRLAKNIEDRIDGDQPFELEEHLSQAEEEPELEPDQLQELDRLAGALTYLRQVRNTIEQKHLIDAQLDTAGEAQPTPQVGDERDSLDRHSATFEHIKQGVNDGLPNRVGRFEIESVLGDGGFARVFLARDPKLNRLIALKIPNPTALISANARARFEREARAAAVLDHPNIVPVFEAGSHGPIHFIASAFCPGASLQSWFEYRERSISPTLAAQIVAQLAGAVQHAHQRGVIHRDLKPANVLIDRDLEAEPEAERSDSKLLSSLEDDQMVESLRVTDFGLAKFDSSEISVTHEGVIVGTPAYMSPEQAMGEADVSPSSDVFSLGVMLYELLTGKLPFVGNTNIETLRAIESSEPLDPRKQDSTIPRDLEAICLRCLSKNPQSRYHTAFGLQEDLERWLNGQTVNARRASAFERVGRWANRNPMVALALTIAFLSLTLGLALTSWKWRESNLNLAEANEQRERAQEQRAQAQKQRERAERNLVLVEDTIDDVMTEMASALIEVPMMLSLRQQVLEQILEIQNQLISEDSDSERGRFQTIDAYRRMAAIHRLLHQPNESREAFERAVNLIDEFGSSATMQKNIQLSYINLHVDQTYVAIDARDSSTAHAMLDAAMGRLDEIDSVLGNEEHLQAKMELFRLRGIVLEIDREFLDAEKAFATAVEIGEGMESTDESNSGWRAELASSLNSLAVVQRRIGKDVEAIGHYVAAAEIMEELVDRYPHSIEWQSKLGTLLFNIGNYYRGRRRPGEALGYFEASVATLSRLAGAFPDHSIFQEHYAKALGGLAYSLDKTGRATDSADASEKALEALQYVPEGFQRLQIELSLRNNLATLKLRKLNDLEGARSLYTENHDRAKLACEKWPTSDWIRKSQLIATLGLADISLIELDYATGIDLAKHALALAEINIDLSPTNRLHQESAGWCLEMIAECEAKRGNYDEARVAVEEMAVINSESVRLRLSMVDSCAKVLDVILESTDMPEESQVQSWVALAIESIQFAMDHGFGDIDHFKNDEDFESLRSNEMFQEFLSSWAG